MPLPRTRQTVQHATPHPCVPCPQAPGPHAHPSLLCPPSSALMFPRPPSSLFVASAAQSAVLSLHFPSPSPSDSAYVRICLRLRLRLSPPTPDSDLLPKSCSTSSSPLRSGLSAVPTATLDRDLDLLTSFPALLPTRHHRSLPPTTDCLACPGCAASWSPPLVVLSPRKWSTAILGVDSASGSLFPYSTTSSHPPWLEASTHLPWPLPWAGESQTTSPGRPLPPS